ncbi:MAG: aminopeptidase P family protein, partial [Candidatus Marinimicrobia bacterium]|nr:aminopeptidase P family protein [Candidatus Neomarinimicrobiota bacterium]
MSQIKNRLASIRDWMSANNLNALIIPHEDEYLSEYIPPECERLAWATGFTGSAGAAVILNNKAAIFVDGRYTVQVRNQVNESLLEYKHLISEPYLKWIQENTDNGAKVGYDSRLHRANWVKSAKKSLGQKLELVSISENPIDLYWHEKPAAKCEEALLLDEKFTGKSSADKRNEIATTLKSKNVDA